ncbi:MAG: hypothetical protein J7M21_01445, partial [Planctomycetes bacterium]|nr:hypothetical protein [Planctomycetota bacterium]
MGLVYADGAGRVRLLRAGGTFYPVTTDIIAAEWKWKKQHHLSDATGVKRAGDGPLVRWSGRIPAGRGAAVLYRQAMRDDGRAVRLDVSARTEPADANLAGVFFFLYVPVRLFRGGRCELIEPRDGSAAAGAQGGGRRDGSGERADAQAGPSRTIAAEIPREPPNAKKNYQFLRGRAKGLVLAAPGGSPRLEMRLARPAMLVVQDDRKFKGDKYSVFFRLDGEADGGGEVRPRSITLTFTAPPDEGLARLRVEPTRKGSRLLGFGGNFCYHLDSPVTGYVLRRIPLAFARVRLPLRNWEPTNDNDSPGRTDWSYFERRDRP